MEETAGKVMKDNHSWYVVYTSANTAKKVKEQLDEAKIKNFLPLRTVVRLWNDEEKRIAIPVIPGCLFVRILKEDVMNVANVQGLTFLLEKTGEPVVIADEDMDLFHNMIGYSGELVEFVPADMQPGARVRVIKGQMENLVGELVVCQGHTKLMVRLGSLGCALVEMPVAGMENIYEELPEDETDN